MSEFGLTALQRLNALDDDLVAHRCARLLIETSAKHDTCEECRDAPQEKKLENAIWKTIGQGDLKGRIRMRNEIANNPVIVALIYSNQAYGDRPAALAFLNNGMKHLERQKSEIEATYPYRELKLS